MSTHRRNAGQHPAWRKANRGPGGRKLCRRCLAEVPAGRQTFCGNACVDAFKVATGASSWVRPIVYKRDRGVCAACGLNTDALARAIHLVAIGVSALPDQPTHLRCVAASLIDAGARWMSPHPSALDWSMRCLVERWLLVRLGWSVRQAADGKSLWEADHIVPVVEGGGGCGLDNYRTLCQPCHAAQTAALAARRAEQRRADRRATA